MNRDTPTVFRGGVFFWSQWGRGVNLKQGYNGDLTSKQAGSIGGQMVNIMTPVRTLQFVRKSRINRGHTVTVEYTFSLAV